MIRACAAMGASAIGLSSVTESSGSTGRRDPWKYCLNTSTIRGQKLPITEIVDLAAKTGYQAIEPWIEEVERYVQGGGSLKDLDRRIRDHGLTVESAIGFAEWIVDDDSRRAKALAQAKREMEMMAQIGGKRLAAPPMGAVDRDDLHPARIAERYRALLEVGDQTGVVPMVEVWGFSKTLHTLGSAADAAIESGHPKACILADVYHLYKGGSPLEGLRLLNASALHVIHMNDYPADPPRDRIDDSDRVYPGDGVAPLGRFFEIIREIGFDGALSLELFSPAYWAQDATTVARTGLARMKAAAGAA